MSIPRNPVGWFDIHVQDMDRAKAFYENVFDLTLQSLGGTELEMWAFPMHPQAEGAAGALVKMPGKDSGPGGVIIYFSCADCAVQAGRVAQSGGTVVKEKIPIGEYGFIAFAHDTEGNLIGLHSMN